MMIKWIICTLPMKRTEIMRILLNANVSGSSFFNNLIGKSVNRSAKILHKPKLSDEVYCRIYLFSWLTHLEHDMDCKLFVKTNTQP